MSSNKFDCDAATSPVRTIVGRYIPRDGKICLLEFSTYDYFGLMGGLHSQRVKDEAYLADKAKMEKCEEARFALVDAQSASNEEKIQELKKLVNKVCA